MAHPQNLDTLLEPLIKANHRDENALRRAVTDVAETLAFLGVLFLSKDRKVISGLTDEQAVILTLNRYVADNRDRLEVNRMITIQNIVSAITRLPIPEPPTFAARRS